ncbi:Nif11-like leader peptide family natural product precursor [Synechococcus sp. KORDI-52]|uniref:Nif11-like leader peptide family natural product precursor n=1 Tax=Synechococcus sp. KORDI-52 TaxID=585425 RepID=UPI0020A69360|nr:Nif11-like leader peptide family natural product precursor [Synechococcus sp. KORDI-52]
MTSRASRSGRWMERLNGEIEWHPSQAVTTMTDQAHSVASKLEQLLKAVANNPSLERQLKMATTASAICEVASSAGIELRPADVVKHYANRLLSASDEVSVQNFDLCSWDAGELLWAMKQWT